MTASWLIQMGWREVYVLKGGLKGVALERGTPAPEVLGLDAAKAETVRPAELSALIERGAAVVVDFDTSLAFRAGHIPGAWFAIRACLAESAGKLPRSPLYVATSPDGLLARLAASELAAATGAQVKVLDGGTAAWRAAGLATEDGETRMADAPSDVYHRPYDRTGGVEQAMRDYLSWEVDLVKQIERDGDAKFLTFPK
jgi:rhodanese-related sulfurtransferase